MKPPNDNLTKPGMTGGRISATTESEYHTLRGLIKAAADVHDVLELAKQPCGHWLYLIRCPLDWVFPKYVIGRTTADNSDPRPLVRCSAEWGIREEWNRLTLGKEDA